ncbi:MAG: nucleotide exchange factor GrpE [Micrococcales bacterium]|nr:nucleotide exchange factor GrpE [Micrococcales bacterium]MCL2666201.1 nucleotide exchange factor GrpE [Micrococcales bacterium]
MTVHDDGDEPRIVDRRKIDPHTGEVREPSVEPEAAPDDASELDSDASALAAERLDQLQRVSADYVNLQNQYSAYVRRSKAEVLTAYDQGISALAEGLIPVLDDIELARQHDDLSGPFASIAEKFEQICEHFGVVRYGKAGDLFDPAVHEALMHGHSVDVTEPTVDQVLQPGYRAGERVLRAARVSVVDPEGDDQADGPVQQIDEVL